MKQQQQLTGVNDTVHINMQRCPDCGHVMLFNERESAWTEAADLVVIPLICPVCLYTSDHFIIPYKADKTQWLFTNTTFFCDAPDCSWRGSIVQHDGERAICPKCGETATEFPF